MSCTVCSHPQVAEINGMLTRGVKRREIARLYGLSISSVLRHTKHYKSSDLVTQLARETAGSKDRLRSALANLPVNADGCPIEQLRHIQNVTLCVMTSDDPKIRLAAIREARTNVELLARLTGELVARSEVTTTISHEMDVGALRNKLAELAQDLQAIDTEGVTQ